jgi:hypothetical protein
VTAEAAGVAAGVLLLLPQRTPRRSLSMSSPLAHDSAARSAEIRSLKFTNAHLKLGALRGMLTRKGGESGTHLDFATCTIEHKDVGSTPGNDLMTHVQTVSSVADGGNEDRNSDIWVHESSNVEKLRGRRTTDSSSGGLRPCCSACPAKILRATGSLFPKNLSWIFCFDNLVVSGTSCLRERSALRS